MGDKVTINTTPGKNRSFSQRYGIERNIINNITKNRSGLNFYRVKILLHIVAKTEKNHCQLDTYVRASLRGVEHGLT